MIRKNYEKSLIYLKLTNIGVSRIFVGDDFHLPPSLPKWNIIDLSDYRFFKQPISVK